MSKPTKTNYGSGQGTTTTNNNISANSNNTSANNTNTAKRYGTYNDFNETSRLLSDSARLAQETDRLGAAVVTELQEQGAVLKDSEKTLSSMRHLAAMAKDSIQSIHHAEHRTRFYLWSAMISLGIANIVVIVQLVRNRGSLYSREEESQ